MAFSAENLPEGLLWIPKQELFQEKLFKEAHI